MWHIHFGYWWWMTICRGIRCQELFSGCGWSFCFVFCHHGDWLSLLAFRCCAFVTEFPLTAIRFVFRRLAFVAGLTKLAFSWYYLLLLTNFADVRCTLANIISVCLKVSIGQVKVWVGRHAWFEQGGATRRVDWPRKWWIANMAGHWDCEWFWGSCDLEKMHGRLKGLEIWTRDWSDSPAVKDIGQWNELLSFDFVTFCFVQICASKISSARCHCGIALPFLLFCLSPLP